MNTTNRLEDWLPKWRKACATLLSDATDSLADRAGNLLPARLEGNEGVHYDALKQSVNDGAKDFVVEKLLPECTKWLREQGSEGVSSAGARSDVGTALAFRFPNLELYLPPPASQISFASAAAAASIGAALGALALAVLSLILHGEGLPVLLFLGAVAGAGLTIGLVGWLAQRPKIVGVLQQAVAASGLLAALGGVFILLRRGPSGLLRSAGWIAGCWAVLLIARPRLIGPSREQCHVALHRQIQQLLAHCADLVLAVCWAHPDHEAPPTVRTVEVLHQELYAPLRVLHSVYNAGKAADLSLRGPVGSVLQRLNELEYRWVAIPAGTSYNAEFVKQFESFGLITEGQRVETLEDAFVRDGALLEKGKLRSAEE
jgi:hypothetical protein